MTVGVRPKTLGAKKRHEERDLCLSHGHHSGLRKSVREETPALAFQALWRLLKKPLGAQWGSLR